MCVCARWRFHIVLPERGVEGDPAVRRRVEAGGQRLLGADREPTSTGHRTPIALGERGGEHDGGPRDERGGRRAPSAGLPVVAGPHRGISTDSWAALGVGRRGQQQGRSERKCEQDARHALDVEMSLDPILPPGGGIFVASVGEARVRRGSLIGSTLPMWVYALIR